MGRMLGGRYEIEEKIGTGGMAIVYKAKDTLLNRTVAIKVLREQFASDEGFIRRFRREAQSAASLSHPNIVSIYDVGKDGQEDYIVMEYVKGRTLKDIIRKQAPLPAEQAILLVRQIGEALAHAHANHIIHRDIKPQNIIVTDDGRVKVTDFGIARAVSAATLTHTGDIVGSVHYLSPEQAKGAQITEQSDLYSLGIILYELITGKVPYDGDTPITIALKHVQEEPVLPGKIVDGVPEELNAIIMKALAKSVKDRYKSAGEFLGDLERILTGQTIIWDKKLTDDSPDLLQTQIHKGLRDKVAQEKDQDKIEDTIHKSKKKIPRPVLLSMLALILFSGIVFAGYKFLYVPEVKVPDVKGLTIEEAEHILKSEGLSLGEKTFDYSDEVEADKIISQSYTPGTMVKVGRAIDVVLSQGVQFLKVPDVTSTNPLQENAINALLAAGFASENIEISTMLSPTVPEGRVIGQSPAPSALWPKNGNIKLYISGGQELTMEVMPDVTGMSSAQAKEILQDYYKLVVTAETEESFLFPPDAVISTLPAAGKPVKQGSEVTIIVSGGPGPPP
ncbi:MAG TPA: Stk1 family PASTA domain-containing Ser/Thr kinase [Peptococcaceae bacterium]|nr:Stk1 family PASTA domain-containing Ser/Thr kinase [Peptococcaceae bacterium]